MHERTNMLIQGIIWGIIFTGFLMLLFGMIFQHPDTPEEKFKVVDKYKNCDVVQYTDPWGAKYHYFLHCNSL